VINGSRIRQARELRALTQVELAEHVDVNQSTVASIESGRRIPSEELLQSISIRTGFPPSFFKQDTPDEFPIGSHLLFRARASVTARQEAQAHRFAQIIYECSVKLANRLTSIPLHLPQLPDETPEVAAEVTRATLGLSPDTPIGDVSFSIERAGVFVTVLPLSIERIDAFSLWAGKYSDKPVIATLGQEFGDRQRFSLAHELGHLVMHQSMRGTFREIEKEANRFAGALLLPGTPMHEELLPPVTLTSLATLKPRWGVSMQAIAMRAFDLGLITERQRTYLFKQMSMRGFRKREPASLDVPLEKPRGLRQMAELLYGNPISYQEFAQDVRLPVTLLQETLAMHAGTSVEASNSPGKVVQFRGR